MRLAEFTDSDGFVCRIDLLPAHDCRNGCAFGVPGCKPGAGGYHGIGSSRWRFSVAKDGMAAQFIIGGTYLPETDRRLEREGTLHAPMLGWDIGFHIDHARHWKNAEEGDDSTWGSPMDECDLLGVPCWYDGSSLRADRWVTPFLTGKMDVWEALRGEWQAHAEMLDAEYPAADGLSHALRLAMRLTAACRAAQAEADRQHADHKEGDHDR